jgi:hypothetical protein
LRERRKSKGERHREEIIEGGEERRKGRGGERGKEVREGLKGDGVP